MSHPADGEAWQHFDRKHKAFADDPRNLRLAVAIDGFNPFVNFILTYSMWPILVTPLNLPPWECVNPSNCFMSLLILGWKDPLLPHNLDVMHIEKNIYENILWTLLKVEGKTKDTMNARLDLHDVKIRPQYHGVQ